MTPTKKPDTEPETVEAEIVDTKEIAVHEVEKQVGTVGESWLTDKQVKLLQRTILKDLQADEMGLAFFKAKSMWANIFAGDLKVYKNSQGQLLFVISRDFLKNKALENPDFLIANSNAVYENDDFEVIDLAKWDIRHSVKFAFDKEKRGKIVGAWCIGLTKWGEKTAYLANIEEYDPHMKSEYLPWNKNKPAMIIKCAEAVVYKRFARLTDVYTQEEVDHILPGKIEKPTKPDISKMEAITSKKQWKQ